MAERDKAGGGDPRIVARADLDEFTERVLDSFWERPEYQRFQPLATRCAAGCAGTSTS